MTSRFKRVIHFANLPIKLLMPTTFTDIREIALKTIPSASKIEIKRVLESLYGFEVDKVRTLNMEGKKKKRGGFLAAKPDYKKAYVTLKNSLSISPDLYPIRIIQEDKESLNKQKRTSFVEEGEQVKRHWLHGEQVGQDMGLERGYKTKRMEKGGFEKGTIGKGGHEKGRIGKGARGGRNGGASEAAAAKFPWTSMRSVPGASR
ncbi:hypothetical protein ACFE04_020013 [Oxalis oulophora]